MVCAVRYQYFLMSLQGLPSFGPYKQERTAVIDQIYRDTDLLSEKNMPTAIRPPLEPKKPVPSVKVIKE